MIRAVQINHTETHLRYFFRFKECEDAVRHNILGQMRRNKTKEYAKMKVIKRGLFLMVALGFEVGVLGPALAAPNPLPVNGTYSFSMVGANVNALTDVPTTAATGVFTVTEVGTTSFNVTNG